MLSIIFAIVNEAPLTSLRIIGEIQHERPTPALIYLMSGPTIGCC